MKKQDEKRKQRKVAVYS